MNDQLLLQTSNAISCYGKFQAHTLVANELLAAVWEFNLV